MKGKATPKVTGFKRMLQNTDDRYGIVSRFFHWAVALLILILLSVGFSLESLPYSPFKGTVYGIHKSFGMVVLILAVARIFWKGLTPQPHHLASHARWEVVLAKVVHILLYFGMIVMPMSGWVMSSAGQHAVPFFWLFNLPPITGPDEHLSEFAEGVHGLAAYALLVAVGLHYTGAVKHHLIHRDATLARMGGNLIVAVIGAVLLAAPVGIIAFSVLSGPEQEEMQGSGAASQQEAAQSQEQAADETFPVTAAPLWKIDKAVTKISVDFMQYGQSVKGSFDAFDGVIRFDPANLPESLADIRIQSASLSTGDAGRDDQAKGAEWFDAAKYPEIHFTARRFAHEGDNRYNAAGTLKIRDVAQDVTLPFTLDIKEGRAVMKASITLSRHDFGVGQGEWAKDDVIGRDVSIGIALEAVQK